MNDDELEDVPAPRRRTGTRPTATRPAPGRAATRSAAGRTAGRTGARAARPDRSGDERRSRPRPADRSRAQEPRRTADAATTATPRPGPNRSRTGGSRPDRSRSTERERGRRTAEPVERFRPRATQARAEEGRSRRDGGRRTAPQPRRTAAAGTARTRPAARAQRPGGASRRPPTTTRRTGLPSRSRRPGSGTARAGDSRSRLTLSLLAVVVAFAFLLLKLGNIQTFGAARFVDKAKQQRSSTETLPATRGVIVDRNGDPLVTTETRKTIWADPSNIEPGKAAEIATALAPIVGVPAAKLQEALEADSYFRYLARKVDDSVAAQVMAFGFRGINTVDEATRLKPAGDLALGVLGSVDTENVGIAGVERSFDQVLTGIPGQLVRERSLDGDHTIPSGRRTMVPATPGSTVMLTLDRNLQQVAEKAVADQVAALQARAGIAVVMDRASGEVLAMASVGRDPATGTTYNDAQNRAITTTFDPGSVMKAVTMSGAIEAGIVSKNTVRRVPPKLAIYEETFVDDSRFQDEDMTVTQILARSSNIGTIGIAQELGEERLMEGIANFGFGATTRVGLEQEERGIVPEIDGEDWSALSLPTLAIGQGITATPLQVLAAYNTIANNGEYVSPVLVRSIVSPDSHDATRVVADRRRVVSGDTAEQVRSMLSAVVGAGTGTRAQVPGYNVAGKTGTAWKARASGGYGSDGDRDYLATFVGFAPVENPRFSIIVTIDEPRAAAITGGTAAAPVFSVIARQALLSYDVPPDAPGWAQPAGGTNLRARPAEAPALPEPVVVMMPPTSVPSGTAAGGAGAAAPLQGVVASAGATTAPGTATPRARASGAGP